jgi:hypothetical protein
MTTGATGQLGLALPVEGELSGTWGDTVNNGITQYTNIAIAATLTLTGDGAVTLANTTGDAAASNITSTLAGAGTVTAQFAIVRISGTLTTTKVVTAPSYSKTYVVVNAATGGAVTFKASGQTGVSVAVGESAYVYYNGTDYVKVAGTSSGAAGGSTTQVQYNSSGSFAGSANLTFDGTTLVAANITDSSLTSGRVTYAGASGNLTDSASLVFDGTTLTAAALSATGVATFSAGSAASPAITTTGDTNTGIFFPAADTIAFSEGGAESMRVDSSGNLIVGAASGGGLSERLSVTGNGILVQSAASTNRGLFGTFGGSNLIAGSFDSIPLEIRTNNIARFLVGTSGQLGIGGANYGTSGQVLTSAGSGAAPTWTTPSAGGSTSIGLVRAIAINCILC